MTESRLLTSSKPSSSFARSLQQQLKRSEVRYDILCRPDTANAWFDRIRFGQPINGSQNCLMPVFHNVQCIHRSTPLASGPSRRVESAVAQHS